MNKNQQMKIIPIREGNYSANKKKEFTPLDQTSAPGGIKMGIQPFLVNIDTEYILLDTGLGFITNGVPLIHECLQKENVKPEQITKILVSHLHKDHIDGIGHFKNGDFIPNFPNAKVYIQERELDFALTQEENPSYTIEVLTQLRNLKNLVLLNSDEGEITDKISYKVCGGHSPFMQVFWIREEGKTAFYGADNLPQQGYLKYHLAYKTDYDGKKALQWRQRWEEEAKENHWIILFYHEMGNPVVQF